MVIAGTAPAGVPALEQIQGLSHRPIDCLGRKRSHPGLGTALQSIAHTEGHVAGRISFHEWNTPDPT
jgi:hypothetical protein